MPDITMCKDTVCHINKNCYRFVAKPIPMWQSYFVGSPRTLEGCNYFWPVEKCKPTEKQEGINDDKS